MSQDTSIVAETGTILNGLTIKQGGMTVSGGITAAGASGTALDGSNITTNGAGALTVVSLIPTNITGGVTGGVSGVAITISGTVASSSRKSKVLPGSAVTSCVLAAGTVDGQDLTVVNVAQAAGSSVSFVAAGSAAASSHLASNVVISGLSSASFSWDANTAVWYAVVN